MATKKTTPPAENTELVANEPISALTVTTKRDGFRRGGRDWFGTTQVPVSDFTAEQLAQIKSEPMLIVHETTIDV